jgi:hypothetical protein
MIPRAAKPPDMDPSQASVCHSMCVLPKRYASTRNDKQACVSYRRTIASPAGVPRFVPSFHLDVKPNGDAYYGHIAYQSRAARGSSPSEPRLKQMVTQFKSFSRNPVSSARGLFMEPKSLGDTGAQLLALR